MKSLAAQQDIAEVAKYGLARFIRLAWPAIEPETFVDNWHIDLVCAHLEAVSRGEITELIINIPPGCMKSLMVNVFWPVWEWLALDPSVKWQFASFDDALVLRDALKAKELIESPWFAERWGDRVTIQKARKGTVKRSESASQYYTTALGMRFSSSVEGKATGWHAHRQVVDDPHKPADTDAKSGVMLEKVRKWWTGTMSTRKANSTRFSRVIIMQRLHSDDLTGFALQSGTYVHIRLPHEYNPEKPCVTKWGKDPRTVKGELLWPARYPASEIAKLRHPITGLGTVDYAAQCDQEPMPPGGGIFKLEYFKKVWTELPDGVQWLQSWDMRFKNVSTSGDFVCGQVWAWKGANFYLVKEYRGRWSFTETIKYVLLAAKEYPQARLKLIEKKANGEAVVDALQSRIPGLVLTEPDGGKEARANAVEPLFEAGNVWIPQTSVEPWVPDYIQEMTRFPRGSFDDRVDCTSQALTRMDGNGIATFAAAMKALRGEK